MVKNIPVNARDIRDTAWIPGSRRSWEKGMATHSSIFAWRLSWTEEPGELYSSWGHKESDTTEAT